MKSYAGLIIDSVKNVSGSIVGKYARFEVSIVALNISPSIYNVYDSSSVDMYAIFTAPSGKQYRRNAFWKTEYSRCNNCPNNIMLQPGDANYCGSGFRDEAENLNPSDPNAYLKAVNTSYNWRIRFALLKLA